MAYEIRSEKGLQIKRKGNPVLATDTIDVKIEQLDEKNKSFVAVASTEHEDRDKDIIRQAGWKLANFKKNPVVPWSHNYYSVPVARSLKTWIDNDKSKGPRLLFKPQFDANDDEAIKIFNKYKNGFLSTFSVGFCGLEFTFRDEKDQWWGGREFTQQELLEISCCAIPANPHASTRLNYAGDKVPENLVQMGYPEVFAKTKTGLFYPVMDIAVFSQPKEFEIAKGIVGVNAVSLDEEIKVSDPVAYIFDSELFDDKKANEWIKTNVKNKHEVKYFDLNYGKDGNFILECDKKETEVKYFDESVDFTEVKTEIEETDPDQDAEDDNDEDDKIDDNEEETDSDKNDKDDQKNTIAYIFDSESFDDKTANLKSIVEVVTTIRDASGTVVNTKRELIGSDQEFKTVDEYFDSKSNNLISLIKDEFAKFEKIISDLGNKKTIANSNENTDNNLSSLESDQHKSLENDDIIELDESLTLSPGENDKTNLNDMIEIDDDMLGQSGGEIKSAVNDTLIKKLKMSLQEAFTNVSGKIDE